MLLLEESAHKMQNNSHYCDLLAVFCYLASKTRNTNVSIKTKFNTY